MLAAGVMRVLWEEWEIGYLGEEGWQPCRDEENGGIRTECSRKGGKLGGDKGRENKQQWGSNRQRVFSTVTQAWIKMPALCRRSTRGCAHSAGQDLCSICADESHTCKHICTSTHAGKLSSCISCTVLHLHHVDRVHICLLPLENRYSCKTLICCDVLSNIAQFNTLPSLPAFSSV